jgi:hypothetical protein
MKKNIDELKLGETYSFNVVVGNQDRKFSGKLNLSPEKCTLLVYGETSEDRHADFPWGNVDHLVCTAVAMTFVLLNLKITHAFKGALEYYPKKINTFEICYELEYVICTGSQSTNDARFTGFELESSSIELWVGETTTQHEIIAKYNNGALFADSEPIPWEFERRVDGVGSMCIGYAASMHFSTSEFSAGIRFPPKFISWFDEPKTGIETIDVLKSLRDFLSVVMGRKITIQAIRLFSSRHRGFISPTLYFSEPKIGASEERYAMFPLGRNPVRNEFGLPEFPLEGINAYFTACSDVRTYFKKYVKYRTLENPEEQFLGYFRLLEKLTFQKDCFVDEVKLDLLLDRAGRFVARYFDNVPASKKLLKQVRRANQSKLNTAGCIIKFMKELPPDLSDNWQFGKSDIEPICQLRNDLIHANEIEPDEREIEIRAKFIEVLLVIALFKSIGITPQCMTLIAPRMHGYDWIRTRPDPIFTTVVRSEDKDAKS